MHSAVKSIAVTTIGEAISKKSNCGRPRAFSAEEILDALLLMCKTSQPWRLLPGINGRYKTLHRNFMHLSRAGVFVKIQKRIVRLYTRCRRPKHHITDTSYIKNVLGTDVVGRNYTDRGRMATKLSTITDDVGVVLLFQLFPGNKSNQKVLPGTIGNFRPPQQLELFADKGYDSRANRAYLRKLGYRERISKRGQRRMPNANRKRIRIEHSYARLKQFRRLRQRYEKLAVTFASFVVVANVHVVSQEVSKLEQKTRPKIKF